jgi:major vault protein
MGDNDRDRARDLVLAPNEFAFISDETKGNINVYVGPHKTSLANTDRPVVFNDLSKRFDRCSLEQATQTLSVAPEGWYLVLKNPAKDGSHPRTGALNNLPDLEVGRKVNTPGPVSFALWPGQMVRVIQGHHLRSNQYLVVRVYDEDAARKNWKDAVFRARPAEDGEPEGTEPVVRVEDLTMGAHLVIRGTAVSFHIPPTGIEVVPDEQGNFVREAITLERLEYCILLDEDGNKRFVRGPAVVFPRPTETFVTRESGRKFRALELNENSGIFVKVIAPYEEDGKAYKVGDELFLTGRDQMIYFPRPEHAIVKYSDQEIHYALAIPAGEGRYVLDRNSGQIRLQRGPSIFLPDPRREVIVRRVLDARTVELWFPGNTEALAVNQRLQELKRKGGGEHLVDKEQQSRARSLESGPGAPQPMPAAAPAPATFAGDDFSRRQTFTQPRTIVLDTRYDGAVGLGVWTGYAVMVVNRSGARRVIVGPHTHLLEYDETLQSLELSTGTPKTDAKLYRTVYLRALNNKVSDVVEAETRDLCRVQILLSYRVNFEGDPGLWFNVENYVKFLTDHLRSLIRHAVKQQGVEGFYAQSAAVLRDVILGRQDESGKRPGRRFEENGMHVYDVEVLDVTLGDGDIAKMLLEAQHASVRQALSLAAERRKLELTRETELTRRAVSELQSTTRLAELSLRQTEHAQTTALRLAEVQSEAALETERKAVRAAEQSLFDLVHAAEMARTKSRGEVESALEAEAQARRLAELQAEVRAVVEKAQAVSPDLVAALQAFGDRALAAKMAESMAPLAILGGESVAAVLSRLLQGTSLARLLPAEAAVTAVATEG